MLGVVEFKAKLAATSNHRTIKGSFLHGKVVYSSVFHVEYGIAFTKHMLPDSG